MRNVLVLLGACLAAQGCDDDAVVATPPLDASADAADAARADAGVQVDGVGCDLDMDHYFAAISAAVADGGGCAVDEDCVLGERTIACPRGQLASCPVALSASGKEALEATFATLREHFCQHCSLEVTPSCSRVRALRRDGEALRDREGGVTSATQAHERG